MPLHSSPLAAREAVISASLANMYIAWGDAKGPRARLHASSLLDQAEYCERAYVLGHNHEQDAQASEPHAAHLNAIFLNGVVQHEKWQNLFKRYGKVMTYKGKPELDLTHYSKRYNIFFSPDAVLEIFNVPYVFEIKTLNTDEFQAAAPLPVEEAVKHSETLRKGRIQCNLYMHFLELGNGVLLAEDKNTQKFRVWALEYDAELIRPILALVERYNKALFDFQAAGILPERHRCCKDINSARARRCPMRDLCFNGEF